LTGEITTVKSITLKHQFSSDCISQKLSSPTLEI
jgi:hypothetical protein